MGEVMEEVKNKMPERILSVLTFLSACMTKITNEFRFAIQTAVNFIFFGV